MKWAPDWDMQVVDAQQLLLRMGEGHSLTLVADEAAVTSKWAQTMGSVFARRKALDAERSRVRQAVTMANLAAPAAVATSARARRMARSENDAASGEAASMDRQILEAGLYQFLCNNSATYADQLASVPSTVRNAVNEVFQQLTAEYLTSMDFDNATPEKRAVAVSLISLVEDFLETAQHYGRIIISEVFIPPREKTIKPVQVGGVIGKKETSDAVVRTNLVHLFLQEARSLLSEMCCSSLRLTWECLRATTLRRPRWQGWSCKDYGRITRRRQMVFTSRSWQ